MFLIFHEKKPLQTGLFDSGLTAPQDCMSTRSGLAVADTLRDHGQMDAVGSDKSRSSLGHTQIDSAIRTDSAQMFWRRWPAIFIYFALLCGMTATVLEVRYPSQRAILLLGPLSSGKSAAALWAAAFASLGLAATIPATIAARGRGLSMMGVLATALWCALLPYLSVVSLLAGAHYSAQPDIHRFSSGSHEYILGSSTRFLGSTNELSLRLYRQAGSQFEQMNATLTPARGESDSNDWFAIERVDGSTILVYKNLSGATERVSIR